MPKEGSLVRFQDGHNQFKVAFIMYADFEAVLEPIESPNTNPEESYAEGAGKAYTKVVNQHIPSGFFFLCFFQVRLWKG